MVVPCDDGDDEEFLVGVAMSIGDVDGIVMSPGYEGGVMGCGDGEAVVEVAEEEGESMKDGGSTEESRRVCRVLFSLEYKSGSSTAAAACEEVDETAVLLVGSEGEVLLAQSALLTHSMDG